MKETFDKKLFAMLITGMVLVALLGGYVYYFGEAVLFATTNREQVLDEKTRWNEYVEAYGTVAERPND